MGRYGIVVGATSVATALVVWLLITIVERKQEARQHPLRLTEIAVDEPDPDRWAESFPRQADGLRRTKQSLGRTKYGGSENDQKLDANPALKRLWAGYPFSIDYREERGHAWSFVDVTETKRLGDQKPGTCFTCKSSRNPSLIREVGAAEFYKTPMRELVTRIRSEGKELAIGCADCHDGKTLALRISRPAFVEAMKARGIDVTQASRQEMRSFVCGQCHVEYYFAGEGKYLTFPWADGLKFDEIEKYYDDMGFKDWVHAETKAPMLKAQHPEFELWSTGIHARSNVACADCHMPYTREGGVKISDHWVRSPLFNISQACQQCHRWSDEELRQRVITIQDRTVHLLRKSEAAILDAIDAIKQAMAAGATDEQLKQARHLHRRAQFRWDFVASENSMGFHSPQEAARVLGDSIDFARQAQIAALRVARVPRRAASSDARRQTRADDALSPTGGRYAWPAAGGRWGG
jgi:nitrite reductase (cytochrome c-552)